MRHIILTDRLESFIGWLSPAWANRRARARRALAEAEYRQRLRLQHGGWKPLASRTPPRRWMDR